ncbi:hypothetical protein CDAR_110991, partial [Caerostris darwini]
GRLSLFRKQCFSTLKKSKSPNRLHLHISSECDLENTVLNAIRGRFMTALPDLNGVFGTPVPLDGRVADSASTKYDHSSDTRDEWDMRSYCPI